MDSILEKKKLRWELLNWSYRKAGCDDMHKLSLQDASQELDVPYKEIDLAYEYLRREDLLKGIAVSPGEQIFGITHDGIVEVEEVYEDPGSETEHFPPNIIVVTGSQNVNVMAGENVSGTQTIEVSIESLIVELRDDLSSMASEVDRKDIDDFVRLLRAPDPNEAQIKAKTLELAGKGETWRSKLTKFGAKIHISASSSIIAKAILSVLL